MIVRTQKCIGHVVIENRTNKASIVRIPAEYKVLPAEHAMSRKSFPVAGDARIYGRRGEWSVEKGYFGGACLDQVFCCVECGSSIIYPHQVIVAPHRIGEHITIQQNHRNSRSIESSQDLPVYLVLTWS